jgi:hypothetical protein
MNNRKQTVEHALGVIIPADYADFLNRYGIYEVDGVEVYGLDDEVIDTEKIPCVIGATKIMRGHVRIPHSFLAIRHTGYEDEVIFLDAESGAVYSILFGELKRISDSFGEWFAEILKDGDE